MAVARNQARWRRRATWVVLLGMLITVVGLSSYVRDEAHFPVRVIQIKNEFRHLDRNEMRMRLAEAVDGGFFAVDLERLRRAALASPWVAEAQVRRVWPDKLVVELKEQQPIARWGDKGLMNERGDVFYPTGSLPDDLVLKLNGPEDKAKQILAFWVDQQSRFKQRGLFIQQVALNARGEWVLGLRGDVEIMVGRERPQQRLTRMLDIFPLIQKDGQEAQRLDLRYEQGFAVRWRQQETI